MNTTTNNKGQVIPFLQNSEYFFKRGVLAYQKKEFQRSVKYLRRAIEINPEQGVFQCQLAAVYADMSEYDMSNDLLHHVLDELDETMYECYFFLANNYAYQGLFDKAHEAAVMYLHYSPEGEFTADAKDLLDLLGIDREDESELEHSDTEDELILTYEKAARKIEEKKYTEAEALLEDIITDYPSYWPAYSQLAQVLYLKGQTEEALAYTKDLLMEIQYLPAVCQMAVFYNDMGHEQEAKAAAATLKNTVPMDRDHLYRVAATLCRVREYEDAHRFFRMFSQRFITDDGNFYFQYGVSSYQTNRPKEAVKWWQFAKKAGHRGAALLIDKFEHGLLTSSDVIYEASSFHRM
ncbi:tetratricopeptide repeat protein [Alteribacillus sp. HJP-4]|uniref:tetratricopeptide repeat protein n=1 Tax=Alteribacillus sp. HJP-4 TaxID=2775394 RepID=UPI0035CCE23E